MIKQVALLFGALAVLLLATGVYFWSDASSHRSTAEPDGDDARAVLRNASGEQVGVVKFSQEDDGVHVKVALDAPLATLSAGYHGFHVHATGTCTADPSLADSTWFTSAGGHYKDADAAHAYHGAHNGDLPIVLVNDDGAGRGIAEARFVTDRFDVADIAGRGLIVHKVADNYRNIPLGTTDVRWYIPNTDVVTDPATATGFTAATGNAGSRMACGVIQD
ncbi:MAG: superoxide dismutase family protein [Dehalococcoidia bacterium]|nr:superoxide dismutase family protein [Dehalococcoidia bacterium]